MPRVARIVIPGVPHHVTQRGNNRQDVFFVDDDRRVYLELLAAQAERFGLKLLGYCLMDNHVHLVATPEAGGMAATESKRLLALGPRLASGVLTKAAPAHRRAHFLSSDMSDENRGGSVAHAGIPIPIPMYIGIGIGTAGMGARRDSRTSEKGFSHQRTQR